MTRSCLLILFSFFAALSVSAETTPEWRNPSVNQQNREARRANFFAYESESLAMKGDKSSSSRYLSMEGMWRFHFVKNHQDAPAAFFRPDFDDSSSTVMATLSTRTSVMLGAPRSTAIRPTLARRRTTRAAIVVSSRCPMIGRVSRCCSMSVQPPAI